MHIWYKRSLIIVQSDSFEEARLVMVLCLVQIKFSWVKRKKEQCLGS